MFMIVEIRLLGMTSGQSQNAMTVTTSGGRGEIRISGSMLQQQQQKPTKLRAAVATIPMATIPMTTVPVAAESLQRTTASTGETGNVCSLCCVLIRRRTVSCPEWFLAYWIRKSEPRNSIYFMLNLLFVFINKILFRMVVKGYPNFVGIIKHT